MLPQERRAYNDQNFELKSPNNQLSTVEQFENGKQFLYI